MVQGAEVVSASDDDGLERVGRVMVGKVMVGKVAPVVVKEPDSSPETLRVVVLLHRLEVG